MIGARLAPAPNDDLAIDERIDARQGPPRWHTVPPPPPPPPKLRIVRDYGSLFEVLRCAPPVEPVGIDRIVQAAALVTEVPAEIILSYRRKHARIRQIVYFLACETGRWSLPVIGRRLGRDHTTVLHGRDLIGHLIERDAEMAETVARVRAAVGESP